MSLRARLLAALLPTILLLFLALTALALDSSRRSLEEQIVRESRAVAESYAGQFNQVFEAAKIAAEHLARSVAGGAQWQPEWIERRIRDTLEQHEFVYGSTVALIPEATPLGEFAPYLYRTAAGIRSVSLATAEYGYLRWDWFQQPLARGAGSWSDPYFDEGGGNQYMVTYSAPIRHRGELVGVATVDITIDRLVEKLRALQIAGSGYAFLHTAKGRLIAHPAHSAGSQASADGAPDPVWAYAGAASAKGPLTEIADPFLGKISWLVHGPVHAIGATLMIVLPRDEVLRPVDRLRDRMTLVAVVIVGMTLLIIVALATNLTAPLSRLVRQANRFAEGHFEERLPTGAGPRETQVLSETINRLGAAIVQRIEQVRTATTEKERYRRELQIAAEIQQGILPHVAPAFPDRAARIRLHGLTRPAREVGGDYYDYFRLSPDRIAMVIADVSGKGVAAALFMAITHTLIRSVAHEGLPPAETLRRVNATLAAENPASMFVTLLYAEYDLTSGRVAFANAGHYAPLLRAADGAVRALDSRPRLPLGAMADSRYDTQETELHPGDCLLFYTDGVTEAGDPSGTQWGLDRLRLALGERWDDPESFSRALLVRIDDFCAPAEQHDDITLLLLQRHTAAETAPAPARAGTVRFEWPARTDVLEEIAILVDTMARKTGLDGRNAQRLSLAVDEVVTNLIRHGTGAGSRFAMEITPLDEGLEVTVIDWGEPFDFETRSRAYDGRATLDQPPGGIGLYLARRSVDEIHYQPGAADGNRLVLVKYRAAPPPSP